MKVDRPLLLLGVPSLSGSISLELHRYIQAFVVCAATGDSPWNVQLGEIEGVRPIEYARNVLCRMALEAKADRLLMIDSDMLPEPTITRLLYHDVDLAVPRMFRFRHDGPNGLNPGPPEIACCATVVNGEERVDLIPTPYATGLHRVHACGTGCLVIRRAILEDPRMRVGENDDDGTPAIFRMTRTATGRIIDAEDIDFSLRASTLGYSVAVDFGARCGHRKDINLDAVFELAYGSEVRSAVSA